MDFSTIDPSVFVIAGPVTLIFIVILALIVRSQKKHKPQTPKKPTKSIEAQQPKKPAPKKKTDKTKDKSKQDKQTNKKIQEQLENEKKVTTQDEELETKLDEQVESEIEDVESEEENSSDDELFPEIQPKKKQSAKNQPKTASSKKKIEKKEKHVYKEEPIFTVEQEELDSFGWEEVNKKGIKRKQRLEAADEQMIVVNTQTSADNTVITIEIGIEPIRAIIGKGRSRVQQIELLSGAKVSVNKEKGLVTISGSAEQAEAGRVLVSNFVTEFTENARLTETATVDVGTSGSAVIGKGGSTLKKIELHSGAKLSLPKESSILSITGTKEQIEKAKVLINNAIYGEASISVDLGEKGFATFMKKNGELIKSVTNLYQNVRLDLKKEENICLIFGAAEDVAEAAQMVTQIINEHSYRKTILVGPSLGMVLGKGGENIKQVQNATDVFIDVDKDDEGQNHRIHLTGQKNRVIRAHDMVEEILASPFNPTCAPGETFIHIEVGEAIRQVIGTKAAKLSEIETTSGAKLNVPNGTSLCVVQGTNGQIQSAKAIIEDIVKRFDEANTPLNVDSFQSSISTLKSIKKIIDYENDWGGTCAAFGW